METVTVIWITASVPDHSVEVGIDWKKSTIYGGLEDMLLPVSDFIDGFSDDDGYALLSIRSPMVEPVLLAVLADYDGIRGASVTDTGIEILWYCQSWHTLTKFLNNLRCFAYRRMASVPAK